VEAESVSDPRIGMLVLKPASSAEGADDAVSAVLQRGLGATLDDQSTLAASRQELSEADARLATLAGNLASRSGFDPAAELESLHIGFVVLADADSGDEAQADVHRRITIALNGNQAVSSVGETANGLLWRVASAPDAATAAPPGSADGGYRTTVLTVQAVIFFLTLLLVIPTTRRNRRVRASTNSLEGPATTFDEDDHA
jgi:hypothetical protein